MFFKITVTSQYQYLGSYCTYRVPNSSTTSHYVVNDAPLCLQQNVNICDCLAVQQRQRVEYLTHKPPCTQYIRLHTDDVLLQKLRYCVIHSKYFATPCVALAKSQSPSLFLKKQTTVYKVQDIILVLAKKVV
jgi:hypothetical protein